MRALWALPLLLACGDEDGGDKDADAGEPVDMDLDGDGVSIRDGDCGDRDATVYPSAAELCDGIDNNCNGQTDEGLEQSIYRDLDGDGYGDASTARTDCAVRAGYVAVTDATFDCDDEDLTVYPGADELCDEADNDCDGSVDEDGSDNTYHADADGDGYASPTDTTRGCQAPTGYLDAPASQNDWDCDDSDADIHPAADEYCDGIDNDCDDNVDDADTEDPVDATTFYVDIDGDGYGDPDTEKAGCEQPSGTATEGDDCDDYDPAISPGADEVCDEMDNDCDGDIDEGSAIDASLWYTDADSDGYGDEDSETGHCGEPSGMISVGGDCDDGDADVNPDATEVCDEVDNNCDGDTDEDGAADAPTWYADSDSDGYGDDDDTLVSCEQPTGYVSADYSGDCDDSDSAISPAATEVCSDGVDNNCDRSAGSCGYTGDLDANVDADQQWDGEDSSCTTGFYSVPGPGDQDGDGYADLFIGAMGCSSGRGAAYVVEGPVSASKSLSKGDGRVTGESSGDAAGFRVGYAGDVDGDGIDDMLIGAHRDDDAATDAGAAYIVYGPMFRGSLSLADVKLTGATDSDYAGSGVAGVGDINGDGNADVLIGAYGEDSGGSNAGAAYLVHGPITADASLGSADVVFTGEDGDDAAGWWVAGGGDTNGDGTNDLLVGASGADGAASGSGAAYLILGPAPTDASLSAADHKLSGETAYDYVGFAVEGAGDVNDDGYDDVIVGAYGQDDGGSSAGAAYLFHGPLSGDVSMSDADVVFTGEATGDYAGFMVAAAGDVNKDGVGDLLIGANRADDSGSSDVGVVYLIHGPVTADMDLGLADARIYGGTGSDYMGSGIGAVGDVDADGYDDFYVAAYGEDSGGSSAGTLYLFYGKGL